MTTREMRGVVATMLVTMSAMGCDPSAGAVDAAVADAAVADAAVADGSGADGAVLDHSVTDGGVGDGATADGGPPSRAQIDCSLVNAPACALGTCLPCGALSAVFDGGTASCSGAKQPWKIEACHVAEDATNPGKRLREFVYPKDLDGTRWGKALCNDGSAFSFTVSFPPGFNALSTDEKRRTPYQIELQGGGQCVPGKDAPDDDKPCEDRELPLLGNYLTTGVPFPNAGVLVAQPSGAGPAGTVDKGLENAVKIWAHYCSSDGWTGQNLDAISDNVAAIADATHYGPAGMPVQSLATASNPTGAIAHWPTTGHFNVQALLDVATERFGLVDANPSLRIHLRGQSAGGWGVMNNAWAIAERFPNALARTHAGGGGIQLSAWQGWIPESFIGPSAGTTSSFIPTLVKLSASTKPSVWDSFSMPACSTGGKSQAQCMLSTNLYDLIANAPGETPAGLGIPLLVYMNRQDELYMGNAGILPLDSSGRAIDKLGQATGIAALDQQEARIEWIRLSNVELGLQPAAQGALVTGTTTSSTRVRWLFSPSDPQRKTTSGALECNVHPPIDWLGWRDPTGAVRNLAGTTAPPDSAANTLELMTERFWKSCGMQNGCGTSAPGGEVHAYDGPGGVGDPFCSVNYLDRSTGCD